MMVDRALHRQVERRRQHREELQLAIDHGLSLDAARERLATYRQHQRRLDAALESVAPAAEATSDAQPRFWWDRD